MKLIRKENLHYVTRGIALFCFAFSVLATPIGWFFLSKVWLLYGILGMVLGIFFWGLQIVRPPWCIVVERLGKFKKILGPGIHFVFPGLESIRVRLYLARQPLDILCDNSGKPFEIDFVDGRVPLVRPGTLYFRIDDPKKTTYEVRNYVDWLIDRFGPIFSRYLSLLRVREAHDDGMGKGNIIARIREASGYFERKKRELEQKISALQAQIEKSPYYRHKYAAELEGYQTELARVEGLLTTLKSIQEELERTINEARDLGMEILSMTISDYDLPPSIVEAREEPLKASRKAEAAKFEAQREATLRADPIAITTGAFMDLGYPEREARERAFELDVLGTLTQAKSPSAGWGYVVRELQPVLVALASKFFGKTSEEIGTSEIEEVIKQIKEMGKKLERR